MSILGIPTLQSITVKATSSILLGKLESKLWELAGAFSGTWGIYQTGKGEFAGSFAENATRIVMSTKVGNTTIGNLIGGTSAFSNIAVEVDSVVELSARKESQISDYRIESGSFSSYNKVRIPNSVNIRITRGGNSTQRKGLLSWLDENSEKTTVFDIVTPDNVYKNMTLEAQEVRRTAQEGGASLIIADCSFRKILEVQPVYYSQGAAKTQNAQSANDVVSQTVQRVAAVKTSATQLINAKIGNLTSAVSNITNLV